MAKAKPAADYFGLEKGRKWRPSDPDTEHMYQERGC